MLLKLASNQYAYYVRYLFLCGRLTHNQGDQKRAGLPDGLFSNQKSQFW
jgi:hypothetical protein